MTPAETAYSREELAACGAVLSVRKNLFYYGAPRDDLDAATIAALWRALEIACRGMSEEALKRMVFGEDNSADVREALKMAREALGAWVQLHENPAGFEGKYGKALDAAIAAQQIKVDSAASKARAALARIDALGGGQQ